jgi:5-methylcytosine-specific restriction endonuclease McrA
MTDEKYTRLGCVGCAAPTKIFVSSGKPAKWCSRECRTGPSTGMTRQEYAEHKREKAKWLITCLACGVQSVKKPSWTNLAKGYAPKFCDKECESAFRAAYSAEVAFYRRLAKEHAAGVRASAPRPAKLAPSWVRAHRSAGRVVECPECAVAYCPLYGHSHMRLCGDEECMRKSKRAASATHKGVRRARIRGAGYEWVNPFKVFKRDRWTCHLCKRKTPQRLRGTIDPLAPELDHIIPLAAGGTHAYVNTACACRSCNQAKSARPLGQLLLIG